MREAAVALLGLAEQPAVAAIKDLHPTAQVTAIRRRTPEEVLEDDFIPF